MSTLDPLVLWIVSALTTPTTDLYLWKMIQKSEDPTLEPYTAARLDLGSQEIVGVPSHFALTDAKVVGISNVEIPKPGGKPAVDVTGSTVKFTAERPNTESPPPGIPAKLRGTAGFEVTPQGDPPIEGTAAVTVDRANLAGIFDASSATGEVDDTVTLEFSSLALKADTGPNIKITIDLQSAFRSFINSVMNKPTIQNKILAALNQELRSRSVLDAASSAGTEAARAAVNQLIG